MADERNIPAANTSFYNPDELAAIIGGEAWRGLEPNSPTEADLLPRDLSLEQVEGIVAAMLDTSITQPIAEGRQRQDLWAAAPVQIEVQDAGQLEKVGFGNTRICYKLTTAEGKAMAVIYCGYSGDLGLQVPPDPRLTLTNETWSRRLWEYSDLRTYLCVPASRYTAVKLQEFGGTGEPRGLAGMLQPSARDLVRRQALARIRHLDNTRRDMTMSELAKPRHYLYKPGQLRPSVSNIPIEERVY
jgi:hypothetical protein